MNEWQILYNRIAGKQRTILKVSLTSGELALYDTNGEPIYGDKHKLVEVDLAKPGIYHGPNGESCYIEQVIPTPVFVVCGGGHVAQPLVEIASLLGFETTVIDDRADFVTQERFPTADRLIVADFAQVFSDFKITPEYFVVMVTRGHSSDLLCLRQALATSAGYIGMIGSKRKAKQLTDLLAAEGYSEEQISRVFSPIGLEIGSETPAEIAVSIMAQVVQEKNKKGVANETEQVIQALLTLKEPAVLATLVAAYGSTPRSPGAKMLILADGSSVGTIGGGSAEQEVFSQVQGVIESFEPRLIKFTLNHQAAANDGMICGGTSQILLQRITV